MRLLTLIILFISTTNNIIAQSTSSNDSIVVIAELTQELGGSKIHFSKFKIIETLRGNVESDTILVGYYFYTQKNNIPKKAKLTLFKYEGDTDLKNYYIFPNYNIQTGIKEL